MRQLKMGSLDAVVTGGPDRMGGGTGPVVVLMHGFGAPGGDLVGLWRALRVAPEVRFVFPAAPLTLPPMYGDGRAWWMIDMERLQGALAAGQARDFLSEDPPGLPNARDHAMRMLDAVEKELGVEGSNILLGGFSQGAMLSCDIAFRTGRPVAGLVLLSGALIAAKEWRPRMETRRGMRVFQSHGKRDPLLPFGVAQVLRDDMVNAGINVTWVEHGGQHEIPMPVLDKLGPFIQATLGVE